MERRFARIAHAITRNTTASLGPLNFGCSRLYQQKMAFVVTFNCKSVVLIWDWVVMTAPALGHHRRRPNRFAMTDNGSGRALCGSRASSL